LLFCGNDLGKKESVVPLRNSEKMEIVYHLFQMLFHLFPILKGVGKDDLHVKRERFKQYQKVRS
jgi:hypothetical protein